MNPGTNENLHCPDCGEETLRLIENTKPKGGEYKEVRTCDNPECDCLVYIIRHTDDDTEDNVDEEEQVAL